MITNSRILKLIGLSHYYTVVHFNTYLLDNFEISVISLSKHLVRLAISFETVHILCRLRGYPGPFQPGSHHNWWISNRISRVAHMTP